MRMRLLFVLIFASSISFYQAYAQVLLPAKQGNLWGYINVQGEWQIEAVYNHCFPFENRDYTWVSKNGQNYLINRQGKAELTLPFGDVVAIYNEVILYRENKKLGWYNRTTGNHVLPQYKKLNYLTDTRQFLQTDSSGMGIVALNGDEILPPIYDEVLLLGSNYLPILKGKFGLVDTAGNRIIENEFDQIYIADKYYVGKKGQDHYQVFDLLGSSLFSGKYDKITYLTNGHFTVEKNKQSSLISAQLGTTVDSNATLYTMYAPHFITVRKDSLFGLYSTISNKLILPVHFESITGHAGGKHILTQRAFLFGLHDTLGNALVSNIYEQIAGENDHGFAMMRQNQKWGLLDQNGRKRLSCQCEQLYLGDDDIAKCRNGKEVSLFEFDSLKNVTDSILFTNTATVNLGGNISMTAMMGSNQGENIGENWFMDNNGRWGLRDTSGNIFLKPFFTQIKKIPGTNFVLCSAPYKKTLHSDTRFKVSTDKQYALIDEVLYRKMTPAGVIFIDTTNLANKAHKVFRVMFSNQFCATINKTDGKILHYNTKYIGKFVNGYAKVFLSSNVFYSFANKRYVMLQTMNEHIRDFRFNYSNNAGVDAYDYVGVGYWAYIGLDGKYIQPINYFKARKFVGADDFEAGRAIVMEADSNYGVIDTEGTFILQPTYKRISRMQNSDSTMFKLEINRTKFGYVDTDGKVISIPQFNKANDYSGGLAWAYTDSKTVLLNKQGIKSAYNQYMKTVPFSEGMSGIATEYRYALIDSNGTQTTDFLFTKVEKCTEGLIPLRRRGGYGFANADGNFLIPSVYKKASSFSHGLAVVRVSNKRKSLYGYINKSGEMVIKAKFNRANTLDENGFAEVRLGSKRGLVNKEGKLVVPTRFQKVFYGEGVLVAGKGLRTVLYTYEGKKIKGLIGKPKFAPSNGHIVVYRAGRYGVMDLQGKNVLPFKYKNLHPFEGDVSVINTGRVCYVINLNGDTTAKINGRAISGFQNGYALVKYEGAYRYYSPVGQVLLNKAFSRAYPFENNLAIVEYKGKYGMIDNNGYYRIYPNYDQIQKPAEGVSIVAQYRLMGVADMNGQYIIAPECTNIEFDAHANVFQYSRNNEFGYFTRKGKTIWKVD